MKANETRGGEGGAGTGKHSERVEHLKERAVSGTKRFIAIFFYLYVVLALFNMHEYVVLQQHNIPFTHFGFALINALVLGKIMLIAEELHLGKHFENYPLMYLIVLNSLLFAAVLMVFHVIEHVAEGLWHGQTIMESLPWVGAGGLLTALVVGAMVTVALMPFFALRAIRQVIGSERMRTVLFQRGFSDVEVDVRVRGVAGSGNAAAAH